MKKVLHIRQARNNRLKRGYRKTNQVARSRKSVQSGVERFPPTD